MSSPSMSVTSFELVGVENQTKAVSTILMPLELKFLLTSEATSRRSSVGKQSSRLVFTMCRRFLASRYAIAPSACPNPQRARKGRRHTRRINPMIGQISQYRGFRNSSCNKDGMRTPRTVSVLWDRLNGLIVIESREIRSR